MDSFYIKEEVIEPITETVYLKEEQECDESIKVKEEPFDYDEPISIQQDPIESKRVKRDDFMLDSKISQVASSGKDFDMTLMDNGKFSQKGRNISQQVRGARSAKKPPCRYTSQSQNIIMNVYEYFGENAPPHTTITEQEKKTAAATKVSVRTIQRIKAAMYIPSDGVIYSPEPPIRHSSVMDNLDDFDRECIRREILSFYRRGDLPTINKLLNRIKDPPLNFNASRSSLYKLLKNIGFYFRRTQNGRAILMEREDIVATRNRYLREIKKNRGNPQLLQEVYLDETWATDEGVLEPKLNTKKGSGCIIIHAGGHQGFIPGALLIYKPKNKAKGDIHEAIDHEQFKTWFEHQLLPNLQKGSLIIMDNAPYHFKLLNKIPTNSNTKSEIIRWLEANNISHDSSFTKGELIYKCKQHKEKLCSDIDQIALKHGHTVLKLPQYCSMLNPIELIWAQVEQKIKNQISSSQGSLKDSEQITRKAIQEITSEQWQRCINQTRKIEEDYIAKDKAQNNFFEKSLIDFHSDESSDDSSDESSDETMEI
ncbi:uncharacterized protein [Palaemon carinicauda]|uniref:uncharacterized protein n=1 Tax=Palaemon carinicauda TaxID=392227 RepID=UPI0035B58A1F